MSTSDSSASNRDELYLSTPASERDVLDPDSTTPAEAKTEVQTLVDPECLSDPASTTVSQGIPYMSPLSRIKLQLSAIKDLELSYAPTSMEEGPRSNDQANFLSGRDSPDAKLPHVSVSDFSFDDQDAPATSSSKMAQNSFFHRGCSSAWGLQDTKGSFRGRSGSADLWKGSGQGSFRTRNFLLVGGEPLRYPLALLVGVKSYAGDEAMQALNEKNRRKQLQQVQCGLSRNGPDQDPEADLQSSQSQTLVPDPSAERSSTQPPVSADPDRQDLEKTTEDGTANPGLMAKQVWQAATWQTLSVGKASLQHLSRTMSFSSAQSELSFQEGVQGEVSSFFTTLPIYCHALFLLMLAILDLVSGVIWQAMGNDELAICTVVSEDETSGMLGLRKSAFVVLSAVLCMNAGEKIFRMLAYDDSGAPVGLKYLYCSSITVWQDSLLARIRDLLILIVTGVLLALQFQECQQSVPIEDFGEHTLQLGRLSLIFQLLRGLSSLANCCHMLDGLQRALRVHVSQNKRRFLDQNIKVDLDLSYICDRVVAMSLPVVHGSIYRNQMSEVRRFFATLHYGKFLVFNLCEDHEEHGNGNYFRGALHHQVQKIPFRDHCVPQLQQLVRFCQEACVWLDKDPSNIVAIHCQGGKGRTGTFTSSLMLWSGLFVNHEDSLQYFAQRRMDPARGESPYQGVSAPCQLRYVDYISKVISQKIDYVSAPTRLITKIEMQKIPKCLKGVPLAITIECESELRFDSGEYFGFITIPKDRSSYVFSLPPTLVARDCQIRFFRMFCDASLPAEYDNGRKLSVFSSFGPGGRSLTYNCAEEVKGKLLMFVAFHTAFHQSPIQFWKKDIDGMYTLDNRVCNSDFEMTVTMADLSPSPLTPLPSIHASPIAKQELDLTRSKREIIPADKQMALRCQDFDEIIASSGACVKLFSTGDVMWPPDQCESGYRKICYITSGHAYYLSENMTPQDIILDSGTSMHWTCIGSGSFFGIEDSLLSEDDGNGLKLIAATEVKVFELVISNCAGDVPLHLPGMDTSTSSQFWEMLAYFLASQCYVVESRLRSLDVLGNAVPERDLSSSKDRSRLVVRIRKSLDIKPSDQLLSFSPGTITTEVQEHVHGFLLVFTSTIIFHPQAMFSGPQTLWQPFDSLQNIKCDMCTLSLNFRHAAIESSCEQGNFSRANSTDSSQVLWEVNLTDPQACRNALSVIENQKRQIERDKGLRTRHRFSKKKGSRIVHAEAFGYVLGSEHDSADGKDFLAALYSLADIQTYKMGETILCAGNMSKEVFHVIKGEVMEVNRNGSRICQFQKGEIFGDEHFLKMGHCCIQTSFVAGSQGAKCLRLTLDVIAMLSTQKPHFCARVFRGLAISTAARHRSISRFLSSRAKGVNRMELANR